MGSIKLIGLLCVVLVITGLLGVGFFKFLSSISPASASSPATNLTLSAQGMQFGSGFQAQVIVPAEPTKEIRGNAMLMTQSHMLVVGGPSINGDNSYMIKNLESGMYTTFYPCTEQQTKLQVGKVVTFFYTGTAGTTSKTVLKESLPNCYLNTVFER